MTNDSKVIIKPNPGPQTELLATGADIVIYGGSAGSGKTYGLLLCPVRHLDNKGFGAVIFRRTYPEITQEGGLWDDATTLYQLLGAKSNEQKHSFQFYSGATVSFSHMQHEKDRFHFHGAQIAHTYFDELTHFTEKQFWYMFSRSRSTCGVKPKVICTTNPDSDSWVRKLVDWWIDEKTGYPIPSRSGKVRYFVRNGETLHWFDTRGQAETYATRGDLGVKSFTFIMAKLSDNPILMDKDPGYLQNLKSLGNVDRERLLMGNWNIRYQAGNVFKREFFKVIDAIPHGPRRKIRYWDRAATEKGGDYTVGARLSLGEKRDVVIEDIVRGQWSPAGVENIITSTATRDGRDCDIWLEQEPGSSGVADVQYLIRSLMGYRAYANKKTGSKLDMARPLSAQVEAGAVSLIRAGWNDDLLREMESFDGTGSGHDDQVDAVSGAFAKLSKPQGTYETL